MTDCEKLFLLKRITDFFSDYQLQLQSYIYIFFFCAMILEENFDFMVELDIYFFGQLNESPESTRSLDCF